jgi:RNase P subunit RPR2
MAPIKSKVGEIRLTTKEDIRVALTCPSCGNDQNFLVKTLQMHVVHLEDSRVEVSEEGRPAVLEVQCDECETALNFDEVDEAVRRELLLTLGAR